MQYVLPRKKNTLYLVLPKKFTQNRDMESWKSGGACYHVPTCLAVNARFVPMTSTSQPSNRPTDARSCIVYNVYCSFTFYFLNYIYIFFFSSAVFTANLLFTLLHVDIKVESCDHAAALHFCNLLRCL